MKRQIFLMDTDLEEALELKKTVAAHWNEECILCCGGRQLLEQLRWVGQPLVLIRIGGQSDFRRITRQVRLICDTARIIWMGPNNMRLSVEGLNAGVDGYLPLPCSDSGLEQVRENLTLRAWIEQRQEESAPQRILS